MAIWVGAIIGIIIGFLIQVFILIYLVKIWGILDEAISYGIVPGLLEGRAKEETREILEIGWIRDLKQAELVCHSLSLAKNDKEALNLYVQLKELLNKKE